MEWLNENSGLVALLSAIVIVALVAACLALVFNLRGKIAVQRLNFLGFYSAELDSRKNYAEIVIGNKSLNDLAISELGIKNGKMSFNLTSLYREKENLTEDARIFIRQRSAIRFRLSVDELKKVLMDGKGGKKVLRTLKVYVVDATGTLYQGRIGAVGKLLRDLMYAERGTERGGENPPASLRDGVNAEPVPPERIPAEELAPASSGAPAQEDSPRESAEEENEG